MPRSKKTNGQAAKKRGPRGTVGPETYKQVRVLVDEKGMPIGQAFKEVARASGRTEGTVAVTYYRVAKQTGGTKRGGRASNGQSGSAVRRGRPPKARASSVVTAVLARVSEAIKELEAVVTQQAQQIEHLRASSGLADRIRKALEA